MAEQTVREAVGVCHDEASLQAAADELLIAGFDRSHLSLLAGDKTVEKELGHKYAKVSEIEDDPAVPYLAYIGSDSRTEAKGAVIGGLAYVGAIGTGLTTPPSISRFPPNFTGVKNSGNEQDERIASNSGPLLSQTSRPVHCRCFSPP